MYLLHQKSKQTNFFSVLTNWIWLYEPKRRRQSMDAPALIQFDGHTKLGGKLEKMRQLGFYFLTDAGKTCDWSLIKVNNNISIIFFNLINFQAAKRRIRQHRFDGATTLDYSYSHFQFGFYQAIIDQFYKFSATEWLLNHIIFPYAHYFMISL